MKNIFREITYKNHIDDIKRIWNLLGNLSSSYSDDIPEMVFKMRCDLEKLELKIKENYENDK